MLFGDESRFHGIKVMGLGECLAKKLVIGEDYGQSPVELRKNFELL